MRPPKDEEAGGSVAGLAIVYNSKPTIVPTMSVFTGPEAARQFQDYLHVIAGESDRGAVLVAASLLDAGLEAALKKMLAPATKKDDPLFNSSFSPLRSFAAKIELAYRLGLINREARQMLDILRDIRNDFAHRAESVSLDGEATKSRIRAIFDQLPEIRDAIDRTVDEIRRDQPAITLDQYIESTAGRRSIFNFFFALNAMALHRLELAVEPIQERSHDSPAKHNGS